MCEAVEPTQKLFISIIGTVLMKIPILHLQQDGCYIEENPTIIIARELIRRIQNTETVLRKSQVS